MAAMVKTNRHGRLAIRLHWTGLPRGSSWEGCDLPDTPDTRAAVQRICDAINGELSDGLFSPARYLFYFPSGNAAAHFRTQAQPELAPTVSEYAAEWLERRRREQARSNVLETYAAALNQIGQVVLPLRSGALRFGMLRLDELTTEHLSLLRAELLATRKVVTVRTYMQSALGAMLREAREVSGWLSVDPFTNLSRWPRDKKARPDPFTVAERDTILGWFWTKERWAWPFVFWQFHTGCRPSESVALRWGNVDVRTGAVRILTSRTRGQENAPKTAGSERVVSVLPTVAQVLRDHQPLHAGPDDYVFTQPDGLPVNQDAFREGPWRRALRAKEIRARKFYATRHTFLSDAVSRGCNPKWLAGYCGTSPAMIYQHYAIYMPSDENQLALLTATSPQGFSTAAAK